MSYHIYTTEGIILKCTPYGEANFLVHVLSEDLGLIFVSAQSVRTSLSKLRSGLVQYSLGKISVLHGKNGWKTTGMMTERNFFFDVETKDSEEKNKSMARIVNLILNMIPGETPHPEIFHTVKNGWVYLITVTVEEVATVESIIVLRILYHLGYVVRDNETEIFLGPNTDSIEWNTDLLRHANNVRQRLIAIINLGLASSNLAS